MPAFSKRFGTIGPRSSGWAWRLLILLAISSGLTSNAWGQQEEEQATALYNTAANLFGDKDYPLAIAQYNRILDEFPGFSRRRDTQHYLALAHYNLQQYEQAVQHFSALRDSLPNLTDYRRSEKMLLYLAFSQYQVGKTQGATGVESLRESLKTYQQFFENFASSEMAAEALFYQGEAYYELNRLDDTARTLEQAAKCYQQVWDQYPQSDIGGRAQYAYGACLEESGKYVEADQVYASFIEKYANEPKTDEVRLRRANTLLQLGVATKNSGDSEQAQAWFEKADQIYKPLMENPDFPGRVTAMNQRGYGLLHLGQYREAADLYAQIANDHRDFEFADDAALDAGKYYFTAGQMDLAEKWLTKVASDFENHRAEATHWLCRILVEKGDFQAALDLASQALANQPGIHEVNLRMDAADALYGMPPRRAEAVAAFQQVADQFADHSVAPKALYYAAFGHLTLNENAQAIAAGQRFQKQYAESEFLPDTLEVVGQAALKEKQLDLADQTFRELVRGFTEHARHDWWQTRVGWVAYLQGQYDDAIGWLSQSVLQLQDPVSISEAHFVMGSSQFELKNYEKAVSSLVASLDANPNRSNGNDVRMLTARAWSKLGENDKAREVVSRLWSENQDPQAAYWLGEFSYQAGDFLEAAKSYSQVLASDQESELVPDALYGLAWAQSSQGDTEKALQSFDELIERFPTHSLVTAAWIGRGKTRRIAGDYAGAIQDLDRYLESEPKQPDRFNATLERALCSIGLKDWKAAITALEPLAAEPSTNPDLADDVLFELAWALQEDGQSNSSVATFQKLADNYGDSPHAAEANYHVGQSLYNDQKFEAAIQRYQQTLAAEPNQKVGELAAYKLAWCHFKQEDYDQSLQAFRAQTDNYPDGELKPVGLSMVAESHFQLDQHSEAVTAYKVAIPAIEASNVTNNVRVLAPIHAAQSANKIKDYQSALDYANIVVRNHADSPYVAEAWYELGVAEKGLGDADKAVAAWESAMQHSLGKTGARARCMIGETRFEQKQYEDAIIQFKLVINGYGGRESSEDVKPWQAFAAYEAARCYYVQVAETEDMAVRSQLIDNARDMFQRLVEDYPNDRLTEDAKKQIRTLDSLK